MTTEQAFNLSAALTGIVLVLASFLIREEPDSAQAIRAYRLGMILNALSWLLFMAPADSLLSIASYPAAGAYLWCWMVFAGRRAGLNLTRPALVLFGLQVVAYAWAFTQPELGPKLHVGAVFYLIVCVLVCHSLLLVKKPRTLSDIGLSLTFFTVLLLVLLRSVLVVTEPMLLVDSAYLLYVVWPAFYTATGVFALSGYLEEAQQRHREQSLRDPLTGLLNRRGFDEHLAPVLAYAERQSLPVTLIALDIDRFKQLNDRHGHELGDRVLQSVAELMREALRQGDLAARFGGEEFLVLLAYGDRETGIACADRMRAAMEDCAIAGPDGPVHFSASFGVASTRGACEFELLYREADAALYRAKAGGRNRVEA